MLTKAFHGHQAAIELLDAFRAADGEFDMIVRLGFTEHGQRNDVTSTVYLLFTIGEITAALTAKQTTRLATMLIEDPPQVNEDMQTQFRNFGRLLLDVVKDAPIPSDTVH
jgi:hypothetical protein